ncbi:MAG TPA: hypothetical protein VD994_05240, partial [Prosthecobacter sp.]|nr:hypothetical protein [Prosthecobacter sp.]
MKARLPLLLTLLVSGLDGAEIHVRPEGHQPITKAVQAAAPGDKLVIEPGVYLECVEVKKTLTILGETGAILDGSRVLDAVWTPAGGHLPGVFAAKVKARPYGVVVDGKLVAEVRYSSAQKEGEWHWETLLRRGPPLSGFEQIRALWVFHPQ